MFRKIVSLVCVVAVGAGLTLGGCFGPSVPTGTIGGDAGTDGSDASGTDSLLDAGTADASVLSDAGAAPDGSGNACPSPDPDAGVCNCVALQPVTATLSCADAGSLPSFGGGTILDGTYVETAMVSTMGPDPAERTACGTIGPNMMSIVVSGSSWQIAGGAAPPEIGTTRAFWNATASTSGSSLSLTFSCASAPQTVPDGGVKTYQYTATATGLELGSPNGVLNFTRQSIDGGSGASLDAGGADASLDGSAADGGGGDASFACAQPANPAPVLMQTAVCSAPPPFTGGTIADGTYYTTSVVNYREGDASCTPGLPSQTTLTFANGMLSFVYTNHVPDGGVGATAWYVGPYTTQGASLTFAGACSYPDGGVPSAGTTLSYSATPTTLTWGLTVSGGVDVGIATKQ